MSAKQVSNVQVLPVPPRLRASLDTLPMSRGGVDIGEAGESGKRLLPHARQLALGRHTDSFARMAPRYVHLSPEQELPELKAGPFRAIIIANQAVSEAWLDRVTKWIVVSGCLYVVAWGVDCETWHDSVDCAILEIFDYGDIPDERFVMTTWHDDEPLSEALWFAGHCAVHPDIELAETIILHVALEEKASDMLQAYSDSQAMADDA